MRRCRRSSAPIFTTRLASWLEGAHRRAADRAGGDRRLPPRAGVSRPGRARSGRRRGPRRRSEREVTCSDERDDARSIAASSRRRRRSSSVHAGSSRSSPPSAPAAPGPRPGASRHRGARGRRRGSRRGDRGMRARNDDEPTELRAEIERAHVAFMRAPSDPERAARRSRDGRSRCSKRSAATQTSRMPGSSWASPSSPRATEARSSWRFSRPVSTRIASGDTRRQIEAWNEVGGAMLFGRTPVDEVLAFLDEELAWARERGLAAVEADALLGGPYLYARLGRFDEARDRLERSKAICRELGIAYGLAEAHMAGAEMEMLAGDAEAAERELRDAIRVATDMGASRYVALYRTRIAHVLVAQGRDEDAARRAGAGKGHLRGCAEVEGRPRARARASRRDGGGCHARPRSSRLPGRQPTTSRRAPRSSSTSPRCSARTATPPAPQRLLPRRSASTRRRETSCPPSAAASFWRQSRPEARRRRANDCLSGQQKGSKRPQSRVTNHAQISA